MRESAENRLVFNFFILKILEGDFCVEKIASFTVDHTVLVPGIYLSRRDGDIVTFDLRFKRPNCGDLLSNIEMHSVEHIMATLLRNSVHKNAVVYFGPMGCQTGFYFLFNEKQLSSVEAVKLVKECVKECAEFSLPMPGCSAKECGNYRNLNVEAANKAALEYFSAIRNAAEGDLAYPV